MNFKNKLYIVSASISFLFILLMAGLCYLLILSGGIEALQENVISGMILLFITITAIAVGTYYFVEVISKPLMRLKVTMQKITYGDLDARNGIKSGDEFQDVGDAIDAMLNDRVAMLVQVEDENEQLNDSVVALLETVVQLAQKDLSIKAKVNEDVTGPLADALNMMAYETSKVLNEVTMISGDVAETSNQVKLESDNVLLLADKEQDEVEKAVTELKSATEAMNFIGKLAERSNVSAEGVITTTMAAMNSVNDTVDSINLIRDSIRLTEKKIKRLGECSQEIGTAVNLINDISERTHTLALNLSMRAVSAGEVGRGFAVVAGEVQRLAENARESTLQITALVNNIQVETASTVSTMNELITQVVSGSQLAENTGQQMKKTQATTTELVAMVKRIAESAIKQANVSKQLYERTNIIRESVRKTGAHLREQTIHTDELVEQAMSLVASVGVFQLMEDDHSTQEIAA